MGAGFSRSMRSRRKMGIALGVAVGLGVAAWWLGRSGSFAPSIQLPPGVALEEALKSGKAGTPLGWETNLYCLTPHRWPESVGLGERLGYLKERFRERLHEMAGSTLHRAPGRPIVDFVDSRLGECFDVSGEKYLLAKEFKRDLWPPAQPGLDFRYLGFIWGGTNHLRHARDRIQLIERSMVQNGIFGLRLNDPVSHHRLGLTTDYFRTNRCAIVRDQPGVVKLVPLEYLRAYCDAGLVKIPSR
jgi:hypothetical protein